MSVLILGTAKIERHTQFMLGQSKNCCWNGRGGGTGQEREKRLSYHSQYTWESSDDQCLALLPSCHTVDLNKNPKRSRVGGTKYPVRHFNIHPGF